MAGYVTPLIAAIVMSTVIDPRHGQCGAARGRTKIIDSHFELFVVLLMPNATGPVLVLVAKAYEPKGCRVR